MEEILEMREEDQTANRKQIVIFQLGEEEYGINILQTKEIIKPSKITNVPNTPDYVLGVINLRGQIVPVIDLRKRFAIAATETTDKQRVITIEVRDSLIGLVVDSVNGVVWLNMNELEPAPEIAGGIEQEFIEGVGKIEDRLLVLIDLEKLLFGNDQEG
ncbi:MAG: purine-binding chemotaxis protein CheW [Halanaerobiales bacterium]|nr:purine-binding chemotaxis protein CheW [Halanaerobiales bacterium]